MVTGFNPLVPVDPRSCSPSLPVLSLSKYAKPPLPLTLGVPNLITLQNLTSHLGTLI